MSGAARLGLKGPRGWVEGKQRAARRHWSKVALAWCGMTYVNSAVSEGNGAVTSCVIRPCWWGETLSRDDSGRHADSYAQTWKSEGQGERHRRVRTSLTGPDYLTLTELSNYWSKVHISATVLTTHKTLRGQKMLTVVCAGPVFWYLFGFQQLIIRKKMNKIQKIPMQLLLC